MRRFFTTFADKRYFKSIRRIKQQAEECKVFDEIHALSEDDLDLEFKNQFRAKLNLQHKGFGYWVWKPQIIKQALAIMNDGDVVLYLDSGCHLNPRGRQRLLEYFEIAQQSPTGILGFQAHIPTSGELAQYKTIQLQYEEKRWTKGDLIDFFGVRDRQDIMDTQTVWGGVIFIKKTPQTEVFIDKWLSVFEKHYDLVDDTPSRSPNLPDFRANRHDQAIFSILCKLNQTPTLSSYETFFPYADRRGCNWKIMKNFPIHVKRDLKLNFWGEIVKLTNRIINRIKRDLGKA